jgi:hypothetical protein
MHHPLNIYRPLLFPSLPTEMAKFLMLCTMVAACLALAAADWSPGTATFYGGVDGSGTMGKHAHSPVQQELAQENCIELRSS